MVSQSSSIENEDQYQNNLQSCTWNFDFTLYNSPLIRIKYDIIL